MVCLNVSGQCLLVDIRVTTYVPTVSNVWVGFVNSEVSAEPDEGSPNVQKYPTAPVLVLVKFTGCFKQALLAVNFVVGILSTFTLISVSYPQPLNTSCNFTVY